MESKLITDELVHSTKSDNFMLPEIPRQLASSTNLSKLFTSSFDDRYKISSKRIAHFASVFIGLYAHYLDTPVLPEDKIYDAMAYFYQHFDDNESLNYGIRSMGAEEFHMQLIAFASSLVGMIFGEWSTEKLEKLLKNIFLHGIIYEIACGLTNNEFGSNDRTAEELISKDGDELEKLLNESFQLVKKRSEVLYLYLSKNHANDSIENKITLAYNWDILLSKTK